MSSTATKHQASRSEISPRDIDVMMAPAAAHARKLARSLKLSQAEREDAEQDILLILLERWHYFDDARGSNIAFAIRIARQALHAIAGRIIADREIAGLDIDFAQDVDDPSGEVEALTIADTLPDDAAPTEAMILDAFALGRFLEGLPQDYALVAQAIRDQDGDLAEAQRFSALSTTEFYRRLRELRYRLVCLELAPRRWLQR
jgi:hypothetical protein